MIRYGLVGEKLIKENTAAMYATLNVNSEEKLHECVTMLRSARRIILTGIALRVLVAQNFAWKLMKIGFNAARSARYACATRNSTGVVP
ncbi:RpiR-family transcriptional regulator [Escherichia coli]|uniref:RpiR-family transcriptional regulator n=1 Tax=Escherichia coli TaxID=562 RepID=A0A377AXX3_ECOLX|nr:RpiR-family transcriptional regulator [Escherichia coli]